jgi:hypothetical protein
MGSPAESVKWREIILHTGDNWPDYRQLIEAWALKSGSLDILRGKADTTHPQYLAKRHELHYLILSSQTAKTRHLLRTVEAGDAETSWKKLRDHYESTTTSSIKQQLKTLMNLKQGRLSVPEFISKAQELHSRLDAAVVENKIEILDMLMQSVLIDGLDSKYHVLQQSLMMDDNIKTDACIAQILEVTQRIDFNHATASTGTERRNEKPTAFKCSTCKNGSHDNATCWIQHPELKPAGWKPRAKRGTTASANQAWRISVAKPTTTAASPASARAANSSPNVVTFTMDSGADEHFRVAEQLIAVNWELCRAQL